MTPIQAQDPYDWPAVLQLIQTAFAGMEGRIDPPSSMHRLTADSIAAQAKNGEVLVIEDPHPVACVFLTPKPDHLYLGKLSTAASHRGQGLGAQLIAAAEHRARALNLPALQLETRIELTENHAYFARHGFKETARTAHPGYERPTSITLRKGL